MSVVWKNFPEINRKVAFTVNIDNLNLPLGCHCGSIQGVNAVFGSQYHAANNGKNVEVLDTTKEKQIVYIKVNGLYDNYHTIPKEETDKIVQYMRDTKLKFSDIAEEGLPQLAQKCSNLPLWVMSDVINHEALVRRPKSGVHDFIYEVFGSTAQFAKYLIDNKIGYIIASPIVQNPTHSSKTNYSLNQVWLWIPPGHLPRALNVTTVYGEEKFPSIDSWITTIGQDLGLSTKEDVIKNVFDGGVFPSEESRFKRAVVSAA